MNAAFLLVSSALLVGQPAGKQPIPIAPPISSAPIASAPIASAPVGCGANCGSNCGSSCASSCQDACGCEGFGHRLRDRMRGLFNRNSCDSCQPSTCHAAPAAHYSTCNDGCKTKTWTWQSSCHTKSHCAPAETCGDACNSGGLNLLGRLRHSFNRGGDSCCDGGCGSTSPSTIITTPGTTFTPGGPQAPLPTEKIEAPKKMPPAIPQAPKQQEVRIQNQPAPIAPNANPAIQQAPRQQEIRIQNQPAPIAPNVNPVAPSIPAVEITPAPAPRVDGERRDPF